MSRIREERARRGALRAVVLGTSIAVLASSGQLAGCSADDPHVDGLAERTRPTGLRVLLVGLDGATWDVVDSLVSAGELPNFAELLRSGARGDLVPALAADPELGWVSILTGRSLWEAGIESPLSWDDALGQTRFALSSDRLVPSLFEVLDAAGLRSLVLGFDLAWPARSKGIFVSNELTGDARMQAMRAKRGSARTLPAELESELRPLLVGGGDLTDQDLQALGPLPEWFLAESRASTPILGHAPTFLRHAWANQLNAERVVLHLLEGASFDLVAVELDALAVCHAMWQHVGDDLPSDSGFEREERLRDAVLEIYRHDDEFLGQLRNELGPDTVVVVAAAYGYRASESPGEGERPLGGFESHFFGEKPASLHLTISGSPEANGMLLFAGGPVIAGQTNSTQLDLLPTLTALLGIPPSRGLAGRIPAGLLDPQFLEDHASEPLPSYEPFVRLPSESE